VRRTNQFSISVIIPVYNTEQFLSRCIDSVLSQTFTDYECILVDDGSTDSSPQICNEYTRGDNRIRAIHKRNGGPSSARNCGIDNSCGDYLFFLDSDDFIPRNALETLYSSIGGAEMCSGSYLTFTRKIPVAKKVNTFIRKYNRSRAMRNILLLRPPYAFLWGKLYKKELFNGLRHADCLYEDVDLIYKLIDRCTEIRCINDVCYYYNLGNSLSITASRYIHAHFAGVENAQKMLNFMLNAYPECGWAAKYYFCQMNLHIYKRMLLSADVPEEDEKKVKCNIRKYTLVAFYDINNIFKSLIKIILFLLGNKISGYVYRFLLK
jgi:glycosyltransferase involved in cell wall biosynthesis